MRLIRSDSPPVLLRPSAPGERSESAVHVSAIVRREGIALGKFTPDSVPLDRDEIRKLRFRIGLCVERDIAEHEWMGEGIIHQPGELELDGIAGNPDGHVIQEGRVRRIEEVKVTWKDPRGFDEGGSDEWWTYLQQAQAYCWMAGEARNGRWEPVRSWRVWIVFVRGEWRGYAPARKRYEFRFSRAELERHWAKMMRARDEMLRLGERRDA